MDSGSSTVYTLVRSQNGIWTVKDNVESAEAIAHPIPGGSVVLDAKNGNRCRANRGGLATVMASSPEDIAAGGVRKTIWVSAGAKGVKCSLNVTGERVERVEWGTKAGKVERVQVIHKNGACREPLPSAGPRVLTVAFVAASVLVAFTDKRQVLIYSLPFLELLHTLQLEKLSAE